MKNSEHHTIKSLKLWENHHNTHTGGGGGGVADMDPPSRSAAESSRVFFSLFGPIPHVPVTYFPGLKWTA